MAAYPVFFVPLTTRTWVVRFAAAAGVCDCDGEAEGDCESDGDADADSDSLADAEADCDADAEGDSDADDLDDLGDLDAGAVCEEVAALFHGMTLAP